MSSTSVKDLLDKRNKESILNSNSKQYSTVTVGLKIKKLTPLSARSFVESLNPAVVRDKKFLPFYCKAAIKLGASRVLLCEKMALEDGVKNRERLFAWLLKQELEAL